MTDEHQAFMIECLIWKVSKVNGYNFNINSYVWEVDDVLAIYFG